MILKNQPGLKWFVSLDNQHRHQRIQCWLNQGQAASGRRGETKSSTHQPRAARGRQEKAAAGAAIRLKSHLISGCLDRGKPKQKSKGSPKKCQTFWNINKGMNIKTGTTNIATLYQARLKPFITRIYLPDTDLICTCTKTDKKFYKVSNSD